MMDSIRVYRGGGWTCAADDCRSASRSGINPGARSSFLGSILGLRLAMKRRNE